MQRRIANMEELVAFLKDRYGDSLYVETAMGIEYAYISCCYDDRNHRLPGGPFVITHASAFGTAMDIGCIAINGYGDRPMELPQWIEWFESFGFKPVCRNYVEDPVAHDRALLVAYAISNPIVAARCIELGLNDDMISLVSQGWTPEEAIGDVLRMEINSDRMLKTVDTDGMIYWHESMDHLTMNKRPGVWQAIKAGKWFQQQHPNLSGPAVDTLVRNELAAHGNRQLKFTRDPKEIRQRYISYVVDKYGRSAVSPLNVSCMRHFLDWPQHPCELYGHEKHNRCKLAYTVDTDGRTLARALVNTADRYHSRVYACNATEEGLIKRLLDEAGYSATTSALEGLEFKVLPHGDSDDILCPYVDGISTGTIVGDYLRFDDDGPVDLHSQSGYTTDGPEYTCDRCGCGLTEDGRYCDNDGEGSWCHECFEWLFATCAECGETVARADSTEFRGYHFCDNDCAINYGATTCDNCGDIMDPDHNFADRISGAPEDIHWCCRECAKQDEHVLMFADGTMVYQHDDDDDDAMFIPEPCWTPQLPGCGVYEILHLLEATA